MPKIISGTPGESWTNDTDLVWWQLFTSLVNVCGSCWNRHGLVGLYWNIPYHRNCQCRQTAIGPGDSSAPFPDRVKEFREMDASQHARAIGKSNWLLLDKGVVDLKDIVLPDRVMSLHEVVAKAKLTVAQLIKVGIAKHVAETAWADAHWTDEQRKQDQLNKVAEDLRRAGVTEEQIRDGFSVGGKKIVVPDVPDTSLERRIIAGNAVMAALWRGRAGDQPIMPAISSATALKAWVEATFPTAVLSDFDWLALIAAMMAANEMRKTFKRLGVDEDKGMRAIQ